MLTIALRRMLGMSLAALAIATTACGGDDSSGPAAPADVSGSYSLQRVKTLGSLGGGGNSLPVTFTDGSGSTLTFHSGSLAIAADGTYALSVEADFNGNDVTLSDEGTYTRSGANITFVPTSNPARMVSAVLSGATMTAKTQFGGIPFEIVVRK
jgi:hypothetical protein